MDQRIFSRRTLRHIPSLAVLREVDGLARSIPRILTRQVSPRDFYCPPIFATFQPHPFVPSPRGSDCDHSLGGGLISDKGDILSTVVWPSNPLMFTGTLELSMEGGLEFITHRLLSLPGRIRFRKFSIKWLREKDTSLTTALLEGCSRTLESLEIACNLDGLSVRHLRLRR